MRHEREEAVLLLQHPRLGAQRARDRRDAGPEGEQEERAFPGVLIVAVALFGAQRLVDLRGERRVPAGDDDLRQQLVHALRAHSRIEERLRGGRLFGVGGASGTHFFDGVGVLVEEPPAHLHGGHHHQDEHGQLKDARRFHSIAASASRSACAKRVRSALVCASDRKQAS